MIKAYAAAKEKTLSVASIRLDAVSVKRWIARRTDAEKWHTVKIEIVNVKPETD